jgi:hypothetical protein
MLARNFLVLKRESGKLADPETDAAETTSCKAAPPDSCQTFG